MLITDICSSELHKGILGRGAGDKDLHKSTVSPMLAFSRLAQPWHMQQKKNNNYNPRICIKAYKLDLSISNWEKKIFGNGVRPQKGQHPNSWVLEMKEAVV